MSKHSIPGMPIEWAGGDMPVEQGTSVIVWHRDGGRYLDLAGRGYAENWEHIGSDGDIVAYLATKNEPPPAKKPETALTCCKNCNFSSPISGEKKQLKDGEVLCRRFPPQLVKIGGALKPYQPVMDEAQWCGEFVQAAK